MSKVNAHPKKSIEHGFVTKEDVLMGTIIHYFQKNQNDIYRIIPIINKDNKTNISLRLLDWFVTNYCRHNMVEYKHKGQSFNVYMSYKGQLSAHSKKLFDPFKRRDIINFQYDKLNPNKSIQTTVGQLNFFTWMLSNGILDYVINNLKPIIKEMNEYSKHKKQRQQKKASITKHTKAKPISPIFSYQPIVLSFD